MILDPVFRRELVATARSWRHFGLRVAYAGLLLVLWTVSTSFTLAATRGAAGEVPREVVARVAAGTFGAIATFQGLAVLALVPALTADAVAGEVRRRTLDFLLATPLSGAAIVLGKLAARLLHAGVLLAIGLPVMSLLTLLGGVDPAAVALADAAAASTALLLGALAMLASVQARNPREALAAAYGLEALWLIGPPALDLILRDLQNGPGAGLVRAALAVNDAAMATSPQALVMPAGAGPPQSWAWGVGRMIAVQVPVGIVLALIAARRLRPAARRRDGDGRPRAVRPRATPGRGRTAAPVRLWDPPACGNDPVFWREAYVRRAGRISRLVWLMLGMAIVGLGFTLIALALPAFRELGNSVLGEGVSRQARRDFRAFLAGISGTAVVLGAIVLGSRAAATITAEREQDTWMSLLATPLTGPEILRGKRRGVLWSLRGLAAVMAVLWGLGILSGAVHPLGVALAAAEAAAGAWFVAALGVYFSQRARTTWRAQAATLGVLFALCGGAICCVPLMVLSPVLIWLNLPFVVGQSLVGYEDVGRLLTARRMLGWSLPLGLGGLLSILAYGAGARWLARRAEAAFDAAADRPRPLHPDLARPRPAAGDEL